jgi:hypothetical protein
VIHSEEVVPYNSSAPNFVATLRSRILCDRPILVSHENFIPFDGSLGFDIGHCLRLVNEAARVPTIFMAQMAQYMDDQQARAMAAVSRGCAELVTPDEMLSLRAKIAAFLDGGQGAEKCDAGQSCPLVEAGRHPASPSAAHPAARSAAGWGWAVRAIRELQLYGEGILPSPSHSP